MYIPLKLPVLLAPLYKELLLLLLHCITIIIVMKHCVAVGLVGWLYVDQRHITSDLIFPVLFAVLYVESFQHHFLDYSELARYYTVFLSVCIVMGLRLRIEIRECPYKIFVLFIPPSR